MIKIKRSKIIILVMIFSLLLVSLVNAGVSDEGVEYDDELTGQFLISDWVHVMVKIKDTTGIVIPHRSSPDFEAKLKERNEIMIRLTNSVLATLSSEEFQFESKSEFGGIFSGNITKEEFEKLLKDTRVKKIYAEKDIHVHSTRVIKSLFILPNYSNFVIYYFNNLV